MRRASRGRSAGFTLVEVLLAVGLFALGASMLLGVFAAGAGLASGADRRADAAARLETIAADLEERLFPLLPDGTVGPPRELVDVPVPGSDRLVYTARPTFEPGAKVHPDLPARVRVDLEVRWRESGRRVALETQLLFTHTVPVGERLRRRFVPGAALEPAEPAAEPSAEDPDSTSS